MDESTQDGSEVLETTEEEADASEEEELTPEQIQELKKKAAERDELEKKNKQLYARVKKDEKEPEQKDEPSATDSLTVKDALLIAKANVDLEDVDEVVEFAKYRKLTIAEALEHKTLKSILSERVEERRSAQAAQTKGPRGSSKTTPEQLIEKARTGNFADMDPDKIAEARMQGKLK